MPRQTRETELPRPPKPPNDWVKIAESGRVWDFFQGDGEDDDFTGDPKRYAGRLKTEARRVGVDFKWHPVEKNGRTILKVLATKVGDKPAQQETPPASSFASAGANTEREV